MRTSNGKKVIEISLIGVIFIIALIVSFFIIYLKTDIFKSEKELFFKYAMQLIEEDNNNQLKQYLDKKSNQQYENNGNINFNISGLEESFGDEVNKVNNINVTFNGKTENAKQKRQQEISLNYNEDINFPISFRQDGDYFGIQTEYIGAKYVTVQNNNLQEFCEKLGISNTEDIPNKIETGVKFTTEEKNALIEKYKETIKSQLTEEQFSKSQNTESTIYVLELTPEQSKNIIGELLNTIKTDETLLAKIREITNRELSENDFEELINELNESEIEENIKIQIYQKNKEFSKISINYGERITISLERLQDKNNLQYNLNLTTTTEETENSIVIKAQYTGLDTLQNVKETYNIEIKEIENEDTISYKYNIENNVAFNEIEEIEEINEDNAIILNNQSDTAVTNFITAIKDRIIEVNESQMEELGVEENPLVYMNPLTMYLLPTIIQQEPIANNILTEPIE